jgi:hypothetical protein
MRTHQVDVTRLVKLASRTALLGVLATLLGCSPNDSVRQDSLAAVLADPGRYEGRVVSVRGFVHLARNQDVIYLHVDDYRWGLEANGIWLHMPKCANRANQPVTSGYMSVVGNLTTKLHGFADGWVGEIDNITQCRLIEGAEGDPRPRPIE